MANSIDYALMAGAVYQDTRAKINWIPIPTGWVETEHKIIRDSGFEVSQFRNGTEIVISYAGTGPGFLFPPQPDWVANSELAVGTLSRTKGVSITILFEPPSHAACALN